MLRQAVETATTAILRKDYEIHYFSFDTELSAGKYSSFLYFGSQSEFFQLLTYLNG
jgi:hypothetical protein